MANANVEVSVKDLDTVKELIKLLKVNFEALPNDVKEYVIENFNRTEGLE